MRAVSFSFRIESLPNPLANPQSQARVSIKNTNLGAPGPAFGTRESTTLKSPRHIRPISAPRPFALWHLASLDAPTVAVVWSLAFAWAAGVRLPPWLPFMLALAVFAVYVFDRLLDARSALLDSHFHRLLERHRFHWRHRRILAPLAAAAACAVAWMILALMPPLARERNSILAAASLAYFARVHSTHRQRPFLPPILTKELLVGLLFTGGCVLPTMGALRAFHHAPLWPLLGPPVFFAALASLNCHAIDAWEPSGESRANHAASSSIPAQGIVMSLAGLLLAVLLFSPQPRAAAILAAGAISALLLAMLDHHRGQLSPVTLRAAADLVLLTPALLVPLAWIPR